jgi:hypothetical protein
VWGPGRWRSTPPMVMGPSDRSTNHQRGIIRGGQTLLGALAPTPVARGRTRP